MFRTIVLALALVGASAFAPVRPAASPRAAVVVSETKSDLVELAGKCNPAVKFFDPLNLAEQVS